MGRRFQFSLAVLAGALIFSAAAFLFAVGPDALLALPVESRRRLLATLHVGGITLAASGFAVAIFGAFVLVARLRRLQEKPSRK
jgi:hypothetical protein